MIRRRVVPMLVSVMATAVGVTAMAPAASAQGFEAEPVFDVELIADRAPLVENDTLRLAAVVTIEPGWHVNSDTPGDEFSMPTTVKWVRGGAIRWSRFPKASRSRSISPTSRSKFGRVER